MNGFLNFMGFVVLIVLFSGYVLCGFFSFDNVIKLFWGFDFVIDVRRIEF